MKADLTLVVPCFNEADALARTIATLTGILADLVAREKIGASSKALFVDDGSFDATWDLIAAASLDSSMVSGIKLSRNVGHQNALLAGLQHVRTEMSISIDADLQDDVSAIESMVDRYHEGFQVVYGVRNNRDSDRPFKRWTARLFYRLMTRLGVDSVENHADFRLLGAPALRALLSFGEVNAYVRGLVPLVGYKTTCVYYRRLERELGESKYSLSKMFSLAARGITSFSVIPLRIIAVFGFIVSIFSGVLSIGVILAKLFGNPMQGWASTTLIIFFMGGIQMLALGIVGEYVGCIYLEVKNRPRYFVEATTE
ncbi:bactoprenol glucosyl transferase [Caballeronia arvi]|uniref:Bactoprenol glucosyl transferase n=1 Tax=Caballeronia arvi TaxID=1777135 RepID=A0A158JDA2_9BURK|nr:glycosyltransferase family 2 protein [Caballeronia arvi]SAL66439.1 bactoprenol glucosyl transferase [Caballeronia arvi]